MTWWLVWDYTTEGLRPKVSVNPVQTKRTGATDLYRGFRLWEMHKN